MKTFKLYLALLACTFIFSACGKIENQDDEMTYKTSLVDFDYTASNFQGQFIKENKLNDSFLNNETVSNQYQKPESLVSELKFENLQRERYSQKKLVQTYSTQQKKLKEINEFSSRYTVQAQFGVTSELLSLGGFYKYLSFYDEVSTRVENGETQISTTEGYWVYGDKKYSSYPAFMKQLERDKRLPDTSDYELFLKDCTSNESKAKEISVEFEQGIFELASHQRVVGYLVRSHRFLPCAKRAVSEGVSLYSQVLYSPSLNAGPSRVNDYWVPMAAQFLIVDGPDYEQVKKKLVRPLSYSQGEMLSFK